MFYLFYSLFYCKFVFFPLHIATFFLKHATRQHYVSVYVYLGELDLVLCLH